MSRAVLALAFRPFFLLGAFSASFAMLIWIIVFVAELPLPGALQGWIWHAHELIFGFSAAVLAGFVLTASQNWSGIRGVHGWRLGLTAGLWLLARVTPLLPAGFPAVTVSVSLAWYGSVALLLWPYLRDRDLRTERVLLLLIAILATGDCLVHLDAQGILPGQARRGLLLGLNALLLAIVFMGGRVIPFFTEGTLARRQPRVRPGVEFLCHASAWGFALTQLWNPFHPLSAAVAWIAALAHSLRLLGWQVRRVRRVPLLWVLHLGYGWLCMGYLLSGLAALGQIQPSLATHALTVGCLSLVILGMISRVALGHTGRRIHPTRTTVVGFALLGTAALVRVFGAWLLPAWLSLQTLHSVSALLFSAAFALYLHQYAGHLLRPRVDGRPG